MAHLTKKKQQVETKSKCLIQEISTKMLQVFYILNLFPWKSVYALRINSVSSNAFITGAMSRKRAYRIQNNSRRWFIVFKIIWTWTKSQYIWQIIFLVYRKMVMYLNKSIARILKTHCMIHWNELYKWLLLICDS